MKNMNDLTFSIITRILLISSPTRLIFFIDSIVAPRALVWKRHDKLIDATSTSIMIFRFVIPVNDFDLKNWTSHKISADLSFSSGLL